VAAATIGPRPHQYVSGQLFEGGIVEHDHQCALELNGELGAEGGKPLAGPQMRALDYDP